MKKLTYLVALIMLVNMAFSNGLLTNTNQSAQFVRMMSRNASLGIDGAYYNPAGLIKLENGWHFSINNQSVFQTKTIDTNFPGLNNKFYEGKVNIPFFPTGFAVYKMNKWALSFGVGPNASGGTTTFDEGIPTLEIPVSKYAAGLGTLTPLLLLNNLPTVSGYDTDVTFEGSSVFWGAQLGITYKVNEMVSVFAGARYVQARNVNLASVNNITLKTTDGQMLAESYLDLVSPLINESIETLQGATFLMEAGISSGAILPDEEVTNPELVQIMTLLDKPNATNQEALDIMTSTKGRLETLQNTDVSNKTVDVEQTGNFFTGIVGANVSINENLNIGLKYEHKNFLTVENNTTTDDLGLFPDGAISRSDIPGIISVGIGYTDNHWFEAQLSYNMYLDKYRDWGPNVRDVSVDQSQFRMREIENSSFDIALGLQLNVSDVFSVSAGGMYQKAGVAESFNSDFSYAAPWYIGVGGGFMWKATDELTLDLGVSTVFYEDVEVTYTDPDVESVYNETYGKKGFVFAVGLSYSIPY